jgi:predicted P-loop ATPase
MPRCVLVAGINLRRRVGRRDHIGGDVMNAQQKVDQDSATEIPGADAPLAPNKADISAHLYALFAPAFVQPYPDAWFEIAYGRPDGALNAAENFSVFDPEKAVTFAVAKNTAGYNVYVGAAIRHGERPKSGRANANHVLDASHAWAEYDGEGDQERICGILAKRSLIPALVITTGTIPHMRCHLYFKLDCAVTPEKLEAANAALKNLLGSDDVQNPDRVLRLAGTVSYPSPKKLERGYVTELTSLANGSRDKLIRAHSAEELIAMAPGRTTDDGNINGNGTTNGNSNSKITINWTKVQEYAGWLKGVSDLPGHDGIKPFNLKGQMIVAHRGNLKDLEFDLKDAGLVIPKPYRSWSDVTFALAPILKADGRLTNEQIAAALMCALDCNRHITNLPDEAQKRRAVERAIARSHEPSDQQKVQRTACDLEWRERRVNGSPVPSMHNARLAITALGITCGRDTFHNKTLFGYDGDTVRHELKSLIGEVSDDGIIALRQLMSQRFGFDLEDKATRDAVRSLALENCFNPVCDMIDKAQAEWDGVERLDSMAVEYLNCEGTEINCAFVRKTMIGLIARARTPGCKFDTIMVLESKEGFNKSTALRVLAGEDNFSDERILGKESREVQEQLSGVWIHENADLAGLKKTDVESIKAYASRQTDIARAAFAHFVVKQPRHSIEVGTTNSSEYLQSQTGNRRFWPLLVLSPIDIKKLADYRMQLIGEAAKYQSDGESVVLDEALWPDAAVGQEKRRTKDPWEDILAYIPVMRREEYFHDGKMVEKVTQLIHFTDDEMEVVAAADLMEHVLKIPVERQTTANAMRVSNAMKQLGWLRHDNGKVTITERRVAGYYQPMRIDPRDKKAEITPEEKLARLQRLTLEREAREERIRQAGVPPNWQAVVEAHGGFASVPPEAWAEYDRAEKDWSAKVNGSEG